MEKIIFNGSLYVKKAPSKGKYLMQIPYIDIYDVNKEDVITISREEDIERLHPFVIDLLEQNGLIRKGTTYDNAGFYHIYINGDKIYMINKSYGKIMVFNTLEEVKKEFIILEDFLQGAKYIGRTFGNSRVNQELIYYFRNMYLLKMPFIDEYTVIDRKDPLIRNDIIGDLLPVYYERDALYKAIVQQEMKADNEQRR